MANASRAAELTTTPPRCVTRDHPGAPAIGHDRDRVSDQKRATAGGSSRPVQHGASIEVAAALDERDAGRELTRPPPRDDRGVVALHPLAIRGRDVDRRSTERVAPLDHGAVEMRMRERDAADSA